MRHPVVVLALLCVVLLQVDGQSKELEPIDDVGSSEIVKRSVPSRRREVEEEGCTEYMINSINAKFTACEYGILAKTNLRSQYLPADQVIGKICHLMSELRTDCSDVLMLCLDVTDVNKEIMRRILEISKDYLPTINSTDTFIESCATIAGGIYTPDFIGGGDETDDVDESIITDDGTTTFGYDDYDNEPTEGDATSWGPSYTSTTLQTTTDHEEDTTLSEGPYTSTTLWSTTVISATTQEAIVSDFTSSTSVPESTTIEDDDKDEIEEETSTTKKPGIACETSKRNLTNCSASFCARFFKLAKDLYQGYNTVATGKLTLTKFGGVYVLQAARVTDNGRTLTSTSKFYFVHPDQDPMLGNILGQIMEMIDISKLADKYGKSSQFSTLVKSENLPCKCESIVSVVVSYKIKENHLDPGRFILDFGASAAIKPAISVSVFIAVSILLLYVFMKACA